MAKIDHKISALLITYNEYANLEKVLPKLKFADEIIIVDSFSNDNSKELVTKFDNIKYIEHKFEDFSSQRNFALSLAKNEWVLFLDADEGLPNDLIQEIKEVTTNSISNDAYFVFRKYHFMNKHLRYSGWQSDKVIRLLKKSKSHYEGYVHEQLKVEGEIGTLKTRIEHFTYKNLDQYIYKLHHYADLKALELNNEGLEPTFFHYLFKPVYRFVHGYFIRLGFLDGYEGLINCVLQSYGVFLRYAKLRELNNKS